MSTPDLPDLVECHTDPRVLDLAAKLHPVFMAWAEVNLNPGEIFDVVLMPHELGIGHHRMRITGGVTADGGGGGQKIPVHKIGNTQTAPEGVM